MKTKNESIKQGKVLKGCFSKIASKTWWDCEFIKFTEAGHYVVSTDKGVKIFTKDQYKSDAIRRTSSF